MGFFIYFWCTYSVLVALSGETIRNSVLLIVHEIIHRKCGDTGVCVCVFFFCTMMSQKQSGKGSEKVKVVKMKRIAFSARV